MTNRMPTQIRRAAVATLIALAACGGGDFVAPDVAPPSTFTLHSFNGASLPAVISVDASSEVALMDDTFAFQDNGTYVERGHLRTTRAGVSTVQTLESPGTYVRDGARITLVSTSGTISGSFSDDTTLTILAGMNTLVFRR
jgi:hypothetical protein